MSHVLTETDVFSPTVTVPDGTDSRDDAAGDVEAIAQALANRTKHLNDHAAKKDIANTYTALQTFNAGITTGVPTTIPLINGNVAISGDLSVGDDLTVTDDAAIGGDLTVTGAATIPNVAGNVNMPGTLTAGAVDCTGDLFAGDDVIASGEFQYVGTKSRSTYLNMFRGCGEWAFSAGGAVNHMEAPAGAKVHIWPICLPHGATLTEVRALVDKAGSGSMTLRVYKKTVNAPFSAAPSEATLGTNDVETGSGVQTLAILALSESINLGGAEYYAHLTSGDAGDIAYQIRVQWTETQITYPGG